MASLRILRPGLLTTVQDLGRSGLQRYGVSVGGAMDAISLRVANSLVGNAESAAALEVTLLGPSVQLDSDLLIAICGGDWTAQADDYDVPMNRPVWLPAGTTLTLGKAVSGCRAYLAVAGGIDVPVVMGSRSTYLLAKIGGHEGRALQAGDVLTCGPSAPLGVHIAKTLKECSQSETVRSVPWYAGLTPRGDVKLLRVVRGTEFERLSEDSQRLLFSAEFEVTAESDRMGYRLAGPPLELRCADEMISAAVCAGTIQIPSDGQAILLMADCATTGGYPKVAQVASVDLPLAGQLKPGDFFRLGEISLAEAHNLYCRREADLRCLRMNLKLKFAI